LTILHLDVETRSDVDLPRRNAYVYFDSPHTDLWCAAWAFDNEEPVLWWPGDRRPPRIAQHVEAGGLIACWNAAFERLAWNKLLGPKHGWPVPDLRAFRCVMAMGYALGLPGRLEAAAAALGLEERKDQEGYRLMLRMSKPRDWNDGIPIWWDEPDRKRRLGEYCLQDVRTEQAVYDRILPLRDYEQAIWFMDQRLNDRGIQIDAELCYAAQSVVRGALQALDTEMRVITDREVGSVSAVAQLTAFVRKHGLEEVDSIAKEELVRLLVRDDLSPTVRRALELRQEGAKTSTAKTEKFLACRQADGRMRGNLQYHGAATGRWSARGAQLQNLPRPQSKVTEAVIGDVLKRDAGYLEMLYDQSPMQTVADCLRGVLVAAPGKKLIVADFSQIEARVTAWLGGQQDVLDAYAADEDIYIKTAEGIYRVKGITEDDPRRQVGKVAVLSLGFQGGAGALLRMAKSYRLEIREAAEAVTQTATPLNLEKADAAWLQRGKKSGVDETRWKTAELIKLAWRDANHRTVNMWRMCEDAALAAVEAPGLTCTAGKLMFRTAGSWLLMRRPSGSTQAYAYPKIVDKEMPWANDNGAKVYRPGLTYWGVDSFTKKWSKQDAYGGLLFQNAVQGTARDVMAEGMARAERNDYAPVLTVHDEVIAECAGRGYVVDEFVELLVQPPTWAEGLPIAAKGFSAKRYRK
jgi:DNA polymerase